MASLDQELHKARTDIQAKRQPDRDTLNADLSNVRAIVESQNQRKPGLNLRYFDDSRSLVEFLRKPVSTPQQERAVFRVDNRPGGPHHAVVDIRKHPDKPLSLVVVESATMGSFAHLMSHGEFTQMVKDTPGLTDARMVVLDAEAQKSPADCVMFSLSFASKMHKEAATFDGWHAKLAADEALAPPEQQKSTLPCGVPVFDGLALLPAAFFKHAHSTTRLFQLRPTIANVAVGHKPDGGGFETLAERKDRYSDLRATAEGERFNSTSIEYKRHSLLKQAVETLAEKDGAR